MGLHETFSDFFERISTWMNANGAEMLVANLAPGATEEALAATEAAFGFSLGAELRALWSIHDGQLEEQNGFIESFDLLSMKEALTSSKDVHLALEYMRGTPRAVDESKMTAAELASPAWVRFGWRDSDGLAVNTATGRVFALLHDDSPPLTLLASSLSEWATRYADAVAADDYRVEEGFGDGHLVARDRAAEARDAERARKANEERARKGQLSPEALMEEATAKQNADVAREALARAKNDSVERHARCIGILFAPGVEPSFIADALRPIMNAITLTPAQWLVVSEGGARLGNNAIRDIALARSRTAG